METRLLVLSMDQLSPTRLKRFTTQTLRNVILYMDPGIDVSDFEGSRLVREVLMMLEDAQVNYYRRGLIKDLFQGKFCEYNWCHLSEIDFRAIAACYGIPPSTSLDTAIRIILKHQNNLIAAAPQPSHNHLLVDPYIITFYPQLVSHL